jgi:acyl carrier protein
MMSATTVSEDKVFETITNALAELGTERDKITREASFESLDVDSLDLVEVGQVIQDQFEVELKGDDMKNVGTVGEVVSLVVERAS